MTKAQRLQESHDHMVKILMEHQPPGWFAAVEYAAATIAPDSTIRDAVEEHFDRYLCADKDACPQCGERRVGNLVWQDESGKYLKCGTCDKEYKVGENKPKPTGKFYTYTDADGDPLKECPGCGHELTREASLSVVLVIAGASTSTLSQLDADGILEDTEDDAIAKGFHSTTVCNGCNEPLIDYDDVTEVSS